ncbi:MAG TPA: DUF5076 domain-containing protein [Sphingomicrobium sp.]|jgi:hypothetical protein
MMLGKRKPEPAGALDLSEMTDHLGHAYEVMRVFIPQPDQGSISGVYIDPPEGFTPFMFGILLADIVHHGSKAFAYKFGMNDAEALYEISRGLSAELATPTDEVKQVIPEADA